MLTLICVLYTNFFLAPLLFLFGSRKTGLCTAPADE